MLYKIQQRLLFLDKLISLKSTGTPKELAKRLNMTERAWYNLRDQLVNDLKIPIVYDHFHRSYIYTEQGNFVMGFKKLKLNEMEKLSGGKYSCSYLFCSFYALTLDIYLKCVLKNYWLN